jgi:hypothetical protein
LWTLLRDTLRLANGRCLWRNREPIELGLPSDASNEDKLASMEKQLELKEKLDPFVDRKGKEVLRQQLPPLYDTLLSLHPSRIQLRLISIDRKQRETLVKDNNFFRYVQ